MNLSSLKSHVQYFLEEIAINRITIKIERFDFNKEETAIVVIYRLGRQKLFQTLLIFDFATKYFENLSNYDRQRVTKFSTLQDVLDNLFFERGASRTGLLNYIKTVVKHDKLF